MEPVKCFHIHIIGRVQGVGFRPHIYRLAKAYPFNGWISNTLNGVHLEAEGRFQIKELCDQIRRNAPPQARIEHISSKEIPLRHFKDFQILLSSTVGEADMELTPDFAICQDCRDDLISLSNRRKGYPFITCTNCGPRYSIIRKLPYDRHLTTMAGFQQCAFCQEEFYNPGDRRFYSQTNSCPACPVQLTLYDSNRKLLSRAQNDIIKVAAEGILTGKILAVKGIGGYLLCADATNLSVIRLLRERKKRPTKPFALMYPSLETAELDVWVNENLINNWFSPESPIVLCKLRNDYASGVRHEYIAPGLKRAGIMFPYAPVFVHMMQFIGKPIIATSGNISGSPIIYGDEEALDLLTQVADLVITNNREIVVPQDDSVIQYTEFAKQKIIIRRSRGLAPSVQLNVPDFKGNGLLAMGAMLKSAFGIKHMNRYYISQFLGDSATLESQYSFEKTLGHMMDLLGFSPEIILTDAHPDYPSTLLGREIANQKKIPLKNIQHHEAHSYAVLAENGLLNENGIVSVIWDGTGYGLDGQVWGGEIFEYSNFSHIRIGQWSYFPHILGDKMSLEPRISALCLAREVPEGKEILRKKFSKSEWLNYNKLLESSTLRTSSVGRMFDAIASLMDITDYNTYEGEAAMLLEAQATGYLDKQEDFNSHYEVQILDNGIFNTADIISGICTDKLNGIDTQQIAAKFHYSLVITLRRFMDKYKYGKVAFSGGVFQNNLLVDLIQKTFSGNKSVYFHDQLSPNDECIPFGQMIGYQISKKYRST